MAGDGSNLGEQENVGQTSLQTDADDAEGTDAGQPAEPLIACFGDINVAADSILSLPASDVRKAFQRQQSLLPGLLRKAPVGLAASLKGRRSSDTGEEDEPDSSRSESPTAVRRGVQANPALAPETQSIIMRARITRRNSGDSSEWSAAPMTDAPVRVCIYSSISMRRRERGASASGSSGEVQPLGPPTPQPQAPPSPQAQHIQASPMPPQPPLPPPPQPPPQDGLSRYSRRLVAAPPSTVRFDGPGVAPGTPGPDRDVGGYGGRQHPPRSYDGSSGPATSFAGGLGAGSRCPTPTSRMIGDRQPFAPQQQQQEQQQHQALHPRLYQVSVGSPDPRVVPISMQCPQSPQPVPSVSPAAAVGAMGAPGAGGRRSTSGTAAWGRPSTSGTVTAMLTPFHSTGAAALAIGGGGYGGGSGGGGYGGGSAAGDRISLATSPSGSPLFLGKPRSQQALVPTPASQGHSAYERAATPQQQSHAPSSGHYSSSQLQLSSQLRAVLLASQTSPGGSPSLTRGTSMISRSPSVTLGRIGHSNASRPRSIFPSASFGLVRSPAGAGGGCSTGDSGGGSTVVSPSGADRAGALPALPASPRPSGSSFTGLVRPVLTWSPAPAAQEEGGLVRRTCSAVLMQRPAVPSGVTAPASGEDTACEGDDIGTGNDGGGGGGGGASTEAPNGGSGGGGGGGGMPTAGVAQKRPLIGRLLAEFAGGGPMSAAAKQLEALQRATERTRKGLRKEQDPNEPAPRWRPLLTAGR